MPERVADAIEEIARPNRGDQQEKPQIHADPALRRPRLIRNTPAWVVAVIVLAAAVAAGWAVFWALGLSAVSERPGLSIAGRLPVRVAAAAVVGIIVGGLLAWAFRPAQTLRRTARTWGTTARRRTPRIPLFGSLTAAVVIGAGLAALATWIISGAVFTHAARAGDVDVVRAALPAIAGAVIAVALVVVYRRQNDTERAQFAQRFGSASTQLGDSDTAVRIAGVYAMAAAADESAVFARRQQCIDVLCGYLRLPYDPDSGANHLSEFVSTTTWSATPPAVNIEESRRQAVRQNDREVRDTIVRVLVQRLARTADASWSGNDFDLTGVLFEDGLFAGARFSGRHVWFDGAVFGPNASFEDVDFNAEVVSFDGASFESDATFAGATFRARSASFDGATFTGKDTSFDDARFVGEYVSFRRVGFSSEATSFGSAVFKCLRASFVSPTEWKNVDFDWDNPPGGNQPAIPRCITPRPWPPYLVARESGTDSPSARQARAAQDKDDNLDG
ncbi:MAG: hypothetical protein QOJ20_5815 [Mycobacterium sp.]|jgi:hypothetical protein|nr:hypothetical protein [Mycobacterium sp.]